jgi:catalase
MEGFGVHTFRLVNEAGQASLVKFHRKPVAGVHSLVWEEAQIAAGVDPDFHRRDMADGIEVGAFLEWERGIQVMPDDGTDSFADIDLLDPTKIVPEYLVPVQLIGKLTLSRNPTNYFAETEQVAFHTGHRGPVELDRLGRPVGQRSVPLVRADTSSMTVRATRPVENDRLGWGW